MAKVTAIAIPGLDLWFNSSDHLPPHFHARKPGCWEVRVFLLTCSEGHLDFKKKWGTDPGRRERKALLQETLLHRVELLQEWEQKVLTKEKM